MEIKKENVVNAYMAGDNSVKEMLRAMFPDIEFEAEKQAKKRPITERVKTFEDACHELGKDDDLVCQYVWVEKEMRGWHNTKHSDLLAYLKLRIICAALNEGWEPQFTEDEWRWYPWFYLWTSEELEEKNNNWKQDRHLMSTGDFNINTRYAGFACAYSFNAPSISISNVGSRLCLKNEALADYCGKQFIELWADFNLIRR